MICGRGYWALGPFFVSGLRHISSSIHALQHEPHDARGPPAAHSAELLAAATASTRTFRARALTVAELTAIPRKPQLGQAGVRPAPAQLMAESPSCTGTKGTQYD
jgi:hypothetical protein